MRNGWIAIWLFVRALRWASVLLFVGFSLTFLNNPAPWLTQFNHLIRAAEMIFFGSGLAFVIAGLVELMLRERAGLPRPALGELIPRPTKP
jgi:hypothetical protein